MRKIQALFALFLLTMASCSTDSNTGVTTVVPSAPTNLTATVISTTQVNLQWTDNATNESGYKVQRKTTGGNFADIGTTGADIATYSDLNLTPNTTYTYRVVAYNTAGNSLQYSNEVTVTTSLVPTITTSAISDTTAVSAKCGGNITSDNGSPVTARGVCWSSTSGPTVALSTKTVDGAGTGSFTSNMTGLTANTTYFVRAYATNANGTAYGNEVSFTTSAVDLTSGLIGFWPFNGNANDESGNGNNGTVNGATLTTDRFGNANKAYSFNGINNYATISGANLCLPSSEVTISVWVYVRAWTNNGGAQQATIIQQGPQNFYHFQFGPEYSGDTLSQINYQYFGRAYSSKDSPPYDSDIRLNRWNNFVFTLKSNTGNIYLNGVLKRAYPGYAYGSSSCPGEFFLGKEGSTFFNGVLDDLRIYNRALNQAEITYLATH